MTTLAFIEAEAESAGIEQALTGSVTPGCHHRQFMLRQLEAEPVLFHNLISVPAPRTIEFDYQRLIVVDADLIDPVFIAVQGEGATVATKALTLDRIHYEVRSEVQEEVP
jgi:hypothetical protein